LTQPTMETLSSTRLRRSDRVDETRVGDRVVLFNRDTGTGIVLNPTGSLVWDSLAVPQMPGDLTARLAARFPSIESERIARDVAGYVDALLSEKLITSDT
jgi:hypothetical protein